MPMNDAGAKNIKAVLELEKRENADRFMRGILSPENWDEIPGIVAAALEVLRAWYDDSAKTGDLRKSMFRLRNKLQAIWGHELPKVDADSMRSENFMLLLEPVSEGRGGCPEHEWMGRVKGSSAPCPHCASRSHFDVADLPLPIRQREVEFTLPKSGDVSVDELVELRKKMREHFEKPWTVRMIPATNPPEWMSEEEKRVRGYFDRWMAERESEQELQKSRNPRNHMLYHTGDKDAPDSIKDANGEVVLGLCKLCGAGERELEERDCVPSPFKFAGKRVNKNYEIKESSSAEELRQESEADQANHGRGGGPVDSLPDRGT